MAYIITFLAGLVVGGLTMFFVGRNNRKKVESAYNSADYVNKYLDDKYKNYMTKSDKFGNDKK